MANQTDLWNAQITAYQSQIATNTQNATNAAVNATAQNMALEINIEKVK